MKSTAALGTATRTVGKLFFALTLLAVAVTVGFGGTALFVYHQFGNAGHPAARPTRGSMADHRAPMKPAPSGMNESSQTRRVAALPSDQPQYTYADNNGGHPSAVVPRATPSSNVPAPLDAPSQAPAVPDDSVTLNDPESHYITDSRTGRVIGIDGSEGARREEEQDRLRQVDLPPRAVAVQTPPPEVRVASPVIEDGQPVSRGAAVAPVSATSSRYLPVRKALPVDPDEATVPAPHTFDVAEYLMKDQDRPVLRAQPVVPAGARVVKTVRVYRLPDGSQSVAAE